MLYAVGDIHGELSKLNALLDKIEFAPEDHVVFLGDYVDRGPDSKGVVDLLIEFSKEVQCTFLIGNHESMLLDFLGWEGDYFFSGDAFLMNGGDRTLASYGYFNLPDPCPECFEFPEEHEAFFKKLVPYYCEAGYLFVHAGIGEAALAVENAELAMRYSRPVDMLWNRNTGFLPHNLDETVIYGHTPMPDFQVQWNQPHSIGIDTGAVYGGTLTAIRLPVEELIQV